MPRRAEFTWSTRREGNDGFVLEEAGPLWRKEFGPMPPHAVLAFVQGRRRLIAMLMSKLGAGYVLEDPRDLFTQSPETNHEDSQRIIVK